MGATHVLDPGTIDDRAQALRGITGGELADLVVEAVGHQTETINECIDLVRVEGTLLAFGVPDDPVYPLRFSDLFRRKAALISSVQPDPQRDFPLALDLVAQGRFDPQALISHQMDFARAQHAFELATHKRDGAVKILLTYA